MDRMTSRQRWRVGLGALAVLLLVAAWLAPDDSVLLLVASLFVGALAMVAPGRLSAYLALLATAIAGGFEVGYWRYVAVNCEGTGGECDIAILAAFSGATVSFLVAWLVIAVLEVLRIVTQRAARANADATR